MTLARDAAALITRLLGEREQSPRTMRILDRLEQEARMKPKGKKRAVCTGTLICPGTRSGAHYWNITSGFERCGECGAVWKRPAKAPATRARRGRK